MIKIGNKTIDADLEVILEELKNFILVRDNRTVLKDIKSTSDNVMVTCPYHKGGEERRPSCGISTIDKPDHPAGTVHCFTCGKTASLDQFISYILGFIDSGSEGRKWLLEHFDVTNNRKINGELKRINEPKTEEVWFGEALLKEYRYYHPYMFQRGLTEEIIERYDIGYDRINDMITFPVRDIKGNCLFIAKRSVKGKFFVLPSNRNKPLYGVYELDYNKPDLYICESFFNALTLAVWGYNAIALMGTGSQYQYDLINKLPFRSIYICLDGDFAGRTGTKKLLNVIDKGKIVYAMEMFEGKDVNDLTKDEWLQVPIIPRSL